MAARGNNVAMGNSSTGENLLDRLVKALESAICDENCTPQESRVLHQVVSGLKTTAAPLATTVLCAQPRPQSRGRAADPALPFFAYGIFAPGQIAFFQIKDHVRECTARSIQGTLRTRDGIPILDRDPHEHGASVNGYRIDFNNPADAELAYHAINDMEPHTQYYWDNVNDMNVLRGRSPQRGAGPLELDPERDSEWSSWADPAFNDALDMVEEVCAEQGGNDLILFYRLQGAYMVLWSSIERYVSLRYGLGRNDKVVQRVKLLASESQFAEALKATGSSALSQLRNLFRSDDPRKKVVSFDPANPDAAIDYLYQVRSNVTHRGKAARVDRILLEVATGEVARIFRSVLRAAQDDARWSNAST